MPIYMYRCRDCDHQFEQRQRMSDDPLKVCPVCEGGIRRVVNSVGVVFKGSGFYVTDNRGSNSANSKASSSTSSEDSSSKEDSGKKEKAATPSGESKQSVSTTASANAAT
jgi:putative FmdB family regulatory protein